MDRAIATMREVTGIHPVQFGPLPVEKEYPW
jgi:hypothetical protein